MTGWAENTAYEKRYMSEATVGVAPSTSPVNPGVAGQRAAVIIGSGGQIGRSCARTFAADGFFIVAVDPVEALNDETRKDVTSAGGTVLAMTADITDYLEMKAAAERCRREAPPVAVLVNCHMAVTRGGVESTTMDDWQEMVRTNLLGPVACSKAFIPLLRAAGGGAIVHVGSVDGTLGNTNVAAYSASKAGLVSLTHVMADELAPHGIRVNCVARAAVDDSGATPPQIQRQVAQTPLGRAARSTEVAAVIRFLASQEASYVTGVVLPVDGGRTAITPGCRYLHDSSPR